MSVVGDDIDDLEDILRDYATEGTDNLKQEESESNEDDKTLPENVEEETKNSTSDKPKEWIKSEKEIQLEKLIFGDKEGLIENLKSANKSKRHTEDEESNAKKRKPAWHDEDDETVGEKTQESKDSQSQRKDRTYKEILKNRFERIVSTPKWANLDRQEDADSDEEILRTVGFLDTSKPSSLQPRAIGYKKLKDLNRATYGEGSVSNVSFHPTSTVAMVSGIHGIATLYAVNGSDNEKLHNIRFKKFPILCARILPCGTQALFGSKRQHYYSYDLLKAKEICHVAPHTVKKMSRFEVSPCGKYFVAKGGFNELHLIDMKTKELIKTFKQNEPVAAFRFSLDSNKIFASSTQSTVSIFDIKQQRQIHKFFDDGCIVGSSLALSPDGKMLATGSGEGAVNIYDYEKVFASSSPRPEKTILNLVTAITALTYNHSSEILAISSNAMPTAVKLVHFPTGTVFANFPGNQNNLQCVWTTAFSPSSGYFALGNSEGQVPLFRMKHYSNY